MRQYYYDITWLDKGRFERNAHGTVIASSVGGATSRAIRDAKKKHGKAYGWNEREGSRFRASIVVGEKTENEKKGGR